jgi:sugar phosphate isomerase/epimerase
MSKPRVALQMYTVRDECEKDFLGTYRAVAKLGYPGVQPAGTGGLAAADFKKALDDLGLALAGAHTSLEALANDSEIEYYLALGTPDVVVAALPRALWGDKDGFLKAADLMNKIGARCKRLGARLSYHNHAFEFAKFDGQYALDIMLAACDPDLVKWEPDVYWVKYGGEDPAAFINKYSGRTPLVHLKDMTADGSRTFAEVGEGTVDFPPIFAAAEASGAEWYIVEQDRSTRPSLEAAVLSLKHLNEWGKL